MSKPQHKNLSLSLSNLKKPKNTRDISKVCLSP